MAVEMLTAGVCPSCRGRGAIYRAWLAREGTCPSCEGSGRAPDDTVSVTISLDESMHASP